MDECFPQRIALSNPNDKCLSLGPANLRMIHAHSTVLSLERETMQINFSGDEINIYEFMY